MSRATKGDDLRPEYDLSALGSGVKGKYYARAVAGTNLVLLEPDVAAVFPDATSVNRALRLLMDVAESSAPARKRHASRVTRPRSSAAAAKRQRSDRGG